MRVYGAMLLGLVALFGVAQAQTPAAVAVAEQALTAANDKTPLTVGFASLVASKAPSFGTYDPRSSNHYKSGESVLFYVEPIGLKHKADGNGIVTCGLTMDILLKRGGATLYSKDAFLNADFPSHHALQEIMLNGTLSVDAPAGAYGIELVLHDHNSSDVTRTTLPFVIDADGQTAK